MQQVLRRFQRQRFAVTLTADYDDAPDLSWADDDIRAQLDSGELGCYVFKVAVYLDGREIGSDYLGNSIYADPGEFAREHRNPDPLQRNGTQGRTVRGNTICYYFPDMVHAAIAEARHTLAHPPRLRH